MIRQKVMLTIMSVCLVNINISAAELLPEESTSSVEISFEEEIEETESDLKLEDSVTTEVVLDQYYEESAVETESYEELVNQEIMDSVPPETESMVNNLKSVEEIIGKTDQIKQISKENEQLMNLQEGELILLSQLSQLVDETTTTLEQYKVAYAINQETGDPLDAMIYRYNGTNHTYILNENPSPERYPVTNPSCMASARTAVKYRSTNGSARSRIALGMTIYAVILCCSIFKPLIDADSSP